MEEGTAILLPVELAGRIGSLEINAEFAYAVLEHRKDELLWGVVVGYPFSERLELLAEMWGTFLTGFHKAEVSSNVGVRWAMTEALTLIASGGFGLDGGPDTV